MVTVPHFVRPTGPARSNRPSRLRRSELAVPATSEKMMTKAAASEADLVFLDLEDAVAPSAKEVARDGAVWALRTLDWSSKTVAVRVNGTPTRWCADDIITVVRAAGEHLDILILPKVFGPDDVKFADILLTQIEDGMGLPLGGIGLEVLIEETEALSRVEAIAHSSSRLEALILGLGDLSASQGVIGGFGDSHGHIGDVWHFARARMTVAARAAGLDAIDGPFPDFKDSDTYRREAEYANALGAVGKWAIHPAQINAANDVFSPSADQVERAQLIIEAVREAELAGEGAANLNGTMIDAASARVYEATVDRARLIGLV